MVLVKNISVDYDGFVLFGSISSGETTPLWWMSLDVSPGGFPPRGETPSTP